MRTDTLAIAIFTAAMSAVIAVLNYVLNKHDVAAAMLYATLGFLVLYPFGRAVHLVRRRRSRS